MQISTRRWTPFVFLLAGACVAQTDSGTDSPRVDTPRPDSASAEQPATASTSTPWEAARLLGVNFRATGQEPGWTLEVHDGETLRYIGDYGRDTVVSPMSQAPAHSSGDRTYSMRVGQRQVDATIREAACADVMNGEAFTHTVMLRVDAQQLSGCGRLLRK